MRSVRAASTWVGKTQTSVMAGLCVYSKHIFMLSPRLLSRQVSLETRQKKIRISLKLHQMMQRESISDVWIHQIHRLPSHSLLLRLMRPETCSDWLLLINFRVWWRPCALYLIHGNALIRKYIFSLRWLYTDRPPCFKCKDAPNDIFYPFYSQTIKLTLRSSL